MKTLVVAPHPDDEVLGAGGLLLRRKAEGGEVAWLIITGITPESGWNKEKIQERANEIIEISNFFSFDETFRLNFPTTKLDQVPMADLVLAISDVFKTFKPEEVLLPHNSDVHTDHRIVFDAVASCVKWFRYPSVKRVLAYETLSETEFALSSAHNFHPNFFVNIEPFLADKLRAIDIYASELGDFPFPRSHEAILALAKLRGVASGFMAAEAFELLRERI
jgi:N-acetylglucosamine malate deacetylase 1